MPTHPSKTATSIAPHFDDQLLHSFMQHFYGYGNYQGDYWFIGMEEGGGDTFDEVYKRLAVWDQRGRQELEDVAAYHLALGITHPFAEKPKLQPTWAKLIRVLLSIEGGVPTKDEVRRYQQRQWARCTSNVCLLELLPLPSPSTSHCLYGQHSQLPDLTTRERYRERWSALRIDHFRQRIVRHHGHCLYFVLKHPAATGVTSEYFQEVGRYIRHVRVGNKS